MFINIKSLNFSSNFGLVLILSLFISTILSPILCQAKKIAIITNTTINGNFDRKQFEQFTSLLNNEVDLNVAIIYGEWSKQYSNEELAQIQSTLENLKIPFKLMERHSTQISSTDFHQLFDEIFESNEFILMDNNRMILGIDANMPNLSENGFIKVETLNQISEGTDLTKIKNVFIISNQSLNQIQNRTNLLNLLKDKNVFWIYSEDKKFSSQVNPINNVIEIALPSTFTSESPGYYLLEEKPDSIFLINKKLKNTTTDIQVALAFKDIKSINTPKDTLTIETSIAKVFEKEYHSSSNTLSINSNNRIYTLLNNGLLYLNDFKGKEIFATELIGRIENNPVLYKDLLLAATVEGDLYSINSNNGEILQVVGIGEHITSDLSVIEIVNGNTKIIGVVFGTSIGNIFCYNAFTFELLWKKNISKNSIISKPDVNKDKVVFINSTSSLFCVNSKSGSLNWKYELSDNQINYANNYPLSDGKNIFSLAPDRNLVAIDILLGKKIWSINTKGVLNQFYLSSDKQKLFLMNSNGVMTIYSAIDGGEIRDIDFKKSRIFSFIIAENQGNTLVGFSDGSLYNIDAKFNYKQLISPTQIPIVSINSISNDEFILKDINGKITLYKIN